MEIEDLQKKRKELWAALKSSHKTLERVNKLQRSIQKRYDKELLAYEVCDRELAMLDGRFHKLMAAMASGDSNKKKRPEVEQDLTEEQIMAIAEKLGLILPEVEEGGDDPNQNSQIIH